MSLKYNLILLTTIIVVLLANLQNASAESEIEDAPVRASDVIELNNESGQISIKLDAASKYFENFMRENIISDDVEEARFGKKKRMNKMLLMAAAAFFVGKMMVVIFAIKAIGLINLKVTISLVFLAIGALIAKLLKVIKLLTLKKMFAYKKVGALKGAAFLSHLNEGEEFGRSMADAINQYYSS